MQADTAHRRRTDLARKPRTISMQQAAAVPLAGLAVLQGIKVRAGRTCCWGRTVAGRRRKRA
jgi:hypothetical protein